MSEKRLLMQKPHRTANSTIRKPVIHTPTRLIIQFTTAMPALPPRPLWNTVSAPANEPTNPHIHDSRKAALRHPESHFRMRRECAFLIRSQADAAHMSTSRGITPRPKLLCTRKSAQRAPRDAPLLLTSVPAVTPAASEEASNFQVKK